MTYHGASKQKGESSPHQSWTLLCRYQIQYTVSDANNVAAAPLTISVTFVEVALVTGSFLFIGQANSTGSAQLQAQQLNATGTVSNAALTAAVASVFQAWLASATSGYVGQLTATLGTNAATVAATNTLELGLFSSVLTADVAVLNATIDQDITAALDVNGSDIVQNYAYNITLQIAVLTADMLLSVFVDVLNSTYPSRRLLGSSPLLWSQPDMHWESAEAVVNSPPAEPPIWHEVSAHFTQSQQLLLGILVAHSQQLRLQGHHLQADLQTITMPSPAGQDQLPKKSLGVLRSAEEVTRLRRSLQSTSSSSAFPLASLLQFKMDFVLAAFSGTSGCSTDTLTDLFYESSDPPDALAQLCGGNGGTQDLSLNQALQAAANSSFPLLQVTTLEFSYTNCAASVHTSWCARRHQ